ncbi:glycosyltransferase family 2 protein [Aurantibacter sp.]|uniref:glycosyltransferase family 2 protein n=1 Tax=Aurantibacter sp. TaxID=2807103 RepID=UPI0035C79568
MKFSIIIPAHNEADVIGLTLESLVNQTLLPKQVIVVNDNSSDQTSKIVSKFADEYDWITLVENKSTNQHLPGTKIINAFYKGFLLLNKDYDVICKFDADLIFPDNYLEILANKFKANPKLGMVAGFCDIKVNGIWQLENLTGKDHIRGALKAYTKTCFETIGQLKTSMGWDTIDELLAKYFGFEILTVDALRVKHLKPTGASYNKGAKHLQGEAMYKMRYGFVLTVLSALKMSLKKRSLPYFINYIIGYVKAIFSKPERLVTKAQGKFIRDLRWKGVLNKLF